MDVASSPAPTYPLSDVTSSLKPTSNGEYCIIPYYVGSYTWNMCFCNDGYCPTPSVTNTRCTPGKFGHYNFGPSRLVSFTLNTDSGGTNGTNQQCLTYYYYLPNITGTQQNIKIRKQETGGDSETIDNVTNSPFNGWIERQVSFSTAKPGYKIYFDLQKTAGSVLPVSVIGIDEISIRVGSCSDQPTTQSTTIVTITASTSTIATTTSYGDVTETSTVWKTTPTTINLSTTSATTELTTTTTKTDITFTSTTGRMTSSLPLSTTTTKSNDHDAKPNNIYIIVLATVIPVVLSATIGVAVCIKKCSPNKKISPAAFELNQVPQRPPPQT